MYDHTKSVPYVIGLKRKAVITWLRDYAFIVNVRVMLSMDFGQLVLNICFYKRIFIAR